MNYVYMLRCRDDSLYCGWTTDLDRRLAAHNAGEGAKYTRSRKPVSLVWFETVGSKEEALRREAQLKRLTRQQKLALCSGEPETPAGAAEVAAALIWRGDRFLICQRPAHKARGLLWEFVGGKRESGETCRQALIRECREELAVTVEPGSVFLDVLHPYPDLTVHLTLFNARIAEGEPQLLEHHALRWITVEEIPGYDFCPADVDILAQLRQRFSKEP